MAEHFDNLLSFHHFLNIAIDPADILLLRHKIFSA